MSWQEVWELMLIVRCMFKDVECKDKRAMISRSSEGILTQESIKHLKNHISTALVTYQHIKHICPCVSSAI